MSQTVNTQNIHRPNSKTNNPQSISPFDGEIRDINIEIEYRNPTFRKSRFKCQQSYPMCSFNDSKTPKTTTDAAQYQCFLSAPVLSSALCLSEWRCCVGFFPFLFGNSARGGLCLLTLSLLIQTWQTRLLGLWSISGATSRFRLI